LGSLIGKAPEIDGHEFTYARFLHGYAIDHIHRTHGLFVVRYDDELRVVAELLDHLREFANVRIIQRRINLIEDTERRRFDEVDREQ
jgi:hypothetical protein